MKFWMRFAARLYPAKWRRRYAAEFEALLDDAQLQWNDLWDILRGALTMQMRIWTFAKVAATCGLLGLAIAAAVAFRTPSEYVSTTVMKATPLQTASGGSATLPVQELDRLEQTVLSRASLSKILIDSDIYKTERASEPLEDIVQNMRNRAIRIQPVWHGGEPATTFAVSFQYQDPAKAQAVTKALAKGFLDGAPGRPQARLELVDPASLPDRPVSPNRLTWIAAGLAIGLLAGSAVFGIGKWPKVAAAGAAGAVITLLGAYFIPDTFRSTAVLRTPDGRAPDQVSQAITDPAFLRSVIQGPMQLYPGKPIDEAVAEMRNRVQIRRPQIPGGSPGTALAVSFDYADETHDFELLRQHPARYKAQGVVRELVAHATEVPANLAGPPLEILDPPSLPAQPFEPNRTALVGFGLLAGLALGIFWQFRGRSHAAAQHA